MQTNFHARLIYTLDKDLTFQPSLDNYLNDYLHKTHTVGTNLQELDLQLQQLNGQIEKERSRKKGFDNQHIEKSVEMNEEDRKQSDSEQNDKKEKDELLVLEE